MINAKLNWKRNVWFFLTACKQKTDWIVRDTLQYFEQFNFVDLCLQFIYI